ncbi:MAG: hypothetical protein HY040_13735 [Planctomycetes bacterium]|nr:hypothetical protein [Planctomycetota bacterium]
MLRIGTLLVFCIFSFGCQRAERYHAESAAKRAAIKSLKDAQTDELTPHWAWLETEARGTPIIFVPSSAKEWAGLPAFWNLPNPALGERTIHLGQEPLNLIVAMAAAKSQEAVKVKVPFGLPDPTPYLPAANPPTLEKWTLGKDLFFAKILTGEYKYACASCHDPEKGFADKLDQFSKAQRNTQSLINCVYNRHQFWDGRVGSLEEVIVRSLEDERPPGKGAPPPEKTHIWGGLVKTLSANKDYDWRFKEVFGIQQPTQDAIAKALATYMRTILSGNSLYDRAEAERIKKGLPSPSSAQYRPFLDEAALKSLSEPAERAGEVASLLETGHALFFGKAGCAQCHSGPLFRDGDFHNTGVAGLRDDPGRLHHLPPGLKENRLVGAFRTPTLRALPRTGPYFHEGGAANLEKVVAYYNNGVFDSPYLAKELRDPDDPGSRRELSLSDREVRALALFLRSLDGTAVDPGVANPPTTMKK